MGRTYSCWMLNCWCITWPVGFKRLNLFLKQAVLTRCRYTCVLYFGWFPGVWIIYATFRNTAGSIFFGCLHGLRRWNRQCVSKRRLIKFRRRGNHPKGGVKHSEHDESLKSSTGVLIPYVRRAPVQGGAWGQGELDTFLVKAGVLNVWPTCTQPVTGC